MQFQDNSLPLYSVTELAPPELEQSSPRKVTRNTAVERERRERCKPIPLDLNEYLNDEQEFSLKQMEGFGWKLAFIRRPLFQEQVIVVKNEDGSKFGVLEKDGSINTDYLLELRH